MVLNIMHNIESGEGMNDKFLVLLQQSVKEYKQSWGIPEDFTICIPQHITDRFAELIVKECVRVCEDDLLEEYMRKCFAAQEEGILYAAVADCCSAMKQHFGVVDER